VRKHFLIVHNPKAGSGRRGLMYDVLGALERAGAEVAVRDAVCEDTGRMIASEAAATGRYDAIVAAGGDGTIRSVAAGLRGTEVPVGILPLGTGNVMAHEIGVARNADSIAQALLQGAAVPAVGAIANNTPFFLMAGVGLDAEAVAALNMRLKCRIGKLAYVWPVVRAIFQPAPALRAVLDGTPYQARWIVVCNAASYAGGFTLSPDSRLFEPGLIAMMCTARTRLGLILDILMIGAAQAKRAPHIRFVPFRRARISADRGVRVQVDGESFGALPLTVSQDNMTVHILTPSRGGEAALAAPAQAAA